MKVVTSYFYQIRFFKPNILPFSTAVWDPKWFHNFQGQDCIFVDKNGVVNGLRTASFCPGAGCEGLCRGLEYCKTKDPAQCAFLEAYYQQLNQLNFDEMWKKMETQALRLRELLGFTEEPTVALIVHEAPTKLCSERLPIQRWFHEHDYPIEEFHK